jgi:hypothetical protein
VWFKLFDGTKEILEVEAVLQDMDRGWYVVNFSRAQTGNLPLGREYSWCIICKSDPDSGGDGTVRQLFTDQTYGAAAPLYVLEGPLPSQIPGTDLRPCWPDADGRRWLGFLRAGGRRSTRQSEWRSLGEPRADAFAGAITIDGSLDPEVGESPSNWFNILTEDYSAEGDALTGNHLIGFSGNYNWFRIKFTTIEGLGTMTYRNA